jgi:hypothetical protein
MGVSGYLSGIRLLSGIRSSFSPDRYPVDYYPVLSGIRQNSIRHIPINLLPYSITMFIKLWTDDRLAPTIIQYDR